MKSSEALKVVLKRNQYISKILQLSKYKSLENEFSQILNVPSKVLFIENCQILSRDWNFKKKKFDNFSFFALFKQAFLYFFLCFLNFISFRNNKLKKKNYHVLVEGILSKQEADRWLELSKYSKKICLIGNNFFKLNSKKIDFLIYKKKYLLNKNDLSINSKIKIFYLFIKILTFSILDNKNYFFLFNNTFYKYLKYKFIFTNTKANFMIEEKFYATSELKNFLFKSLGGKKSACIQKNILEHSISSFIRSDIFFSLATNTAKIIKVLGGYVEKIYPVGSLFMEEKWFKKKKDLKNIEEIDLLIIGINVKGNISKFDITGEFEDTYYEYLQWIVKFSQKFPEKKIVLKHHDNHSIDIREVNLLKSSNVKTIIGSQSYNQTYGYVFKSKIVCSFGSTMIMEYLGLGKICFFLDPNFKNHQFFDYLPQTNKWRISSYKDFEKKLLNLFKRRKFNFKIAKEKNDYCIESSSTSKRISKFLK